ncbi:MAG TPA: hypothetical protein VEX39_07575 [Thermoleophilaceae bacterium]|nr:hypothetical protein [Thermoleophilaceae bacterium]
MNVRRCAAVVAVALPLVLAPAASAQAPTVTAQNPTPVAGTTQATLNGTIAWSGQQSGCNSPSPFYGCPAYFQVGGQVGGRTVYLTTDDMFWTPLDSPNVFSQTTGLGELSDFSPPYTVQLVGTDGIGPNATTYRSAPVTFRWPLDSLSVARVAVTRRQVIVFESRPRTAFRKGRVSVVVTRTAGARSAKARRLGSFSARARHGRNRLRPPARLRRELRKPGRYQLRLVLRDEWERSFVFRHRLRVARED